MLREIAKNTRATSKTLQAFVSMLNVKVHTIQHEHLIPTVQHVVVEGSWPGHSAVTELTMNSSMPKYSGVKCGAICPS